MICLGTPLESILPDGNHHITALFRETCTKPAGPVGVHRSKSAAIFAFSILHPHVDAGNIFIYERFYSIDIHSTNTFWILAMYRQCQLPR